MREIKKYSPAIRIAVVPHNHVGQLYTAYMTQEWNGKYVEIGDYTGLENFLVDLADNGLRFDLNPTHNIAYTRTQEGIDASHFWHEYIKRMDESLRNRARAMLGIL